MYENHDGAGENEHEPMMIEPLVMPLTVKGRRERRQIPESSDEPAVIHRGPHDQRKTENAAGNRSVRGRIDQRGSDETCDSDEVTTVKRMVPIRLVSLTCSPAWISTLYRPGFQGPSTGNSFR